MNKNGVSLNILFFRFCNAAAVWIQLVTIQIGCLAIFTALLVTTGKQSSSETARSKFIYIYLHLRTFIYMPFRHVCKAHVCFNPGHQSLTNRLALPPLPPHPAPHLQRDIFAAAKVHLSHTSAHRRRRDSSGLLLGKQISVQLSRAKGSFPPSMPLLMTQPLWNVTLCASAL